MIYDLDHLPERRLTDSIKWNQFEADVLPMWVADMDFPVAEPIRQALYQRVEHGVFGYPGYTHPKPGSVSELQELLVERMLRKYHWKVAPEAILPMPGVIVGLNLTCHALATAGGGVLIQTPIYPPFFHLAANSGMVLQQSTLVQLPDGHYEIDWEEFEAAITRDTRVFILCNPHNPVGRVYRQAELERMAEICLRHGLTICSDEIHCDLVFDGYSHIPIASLDAEIAQQTITLMSPTKTYNLAGLQCSFAIVPNKDLRERLTQAMQGLVMWVNLMGMTAAVAAYRDGQEWLDQVLAYLVGNRDYLYEYLLKQVPGIRTVKPEGTYLVWLDCTGLGIHGSPCEYFIREARVGFNDGATFGRGGEGFVRLNFACARASLTRALDQMKIALDNLTS